jgi:hypothetical protein
MADALALVPSGEPVEVDDHGRRRPALLESAMSTADATGLLAGAFGSARRPLSGNPSADRCL